MQRPAVVVVEGAPVPVGVPAVAPVPGLQQLQRPLPRTSGLRVTPAHRFQEPGDGVREEVPVVARRKMAQRTSQPVLRPVLHPGLQPVPEPGPGEPQPECDGGGLHHRLPLHMVVQDEGPGLRVVPPGCTCPGSEPAPVAFQPFVRVVPLGPGDPEGGRQEGPRVPLQPVGAHSGVRRGPGQVEQRPAGVAHRQAACSSPSAAASQCALVYPVYGLDARSSGEFERGGREGRHTGRPGPSWWTRSAPEILIERSQAVKRTTRRRPKRSNDQG